MTLKEILESAVVAYGNDGVLADYIGDKDGDFGDTLAKFIVREATDLYDPNVSDEENIAEIAKGLRRAIDQLQAVLVAIVSKSPEANQESNP